MLSTRLPKCVYKHSMSYASSIDRFTIRKFQESDIECNFNVYKTKEHVKDQIVKVRSLIHEVEQKDWYDKMWDDRKNEQNGNKLRLYRLFKTEIQADTYVTTSMQRNYRQALAKLRSGSLPIRVETGRYEDIPLQERLCTFCSNNEVENEIHVLLSCDLYDDLRYDIIQQMILTCTDFKKKSPNEQFKIIMSDSSIQYLLAKYVFNMFQRCKMHDMS